MTQAKKIVVIGATSGLGREMAAQLVRAGYKVGVAGRRSELLGSFVEEYKGVATEPIEQQVIDITSQGATASLDELIERMGGMDILLHVSGAGFENPSLEEGKERHITEVNSVGFVTIIDHAYHWFRTHGGKGHIAAVTSIAGTKGMGVAPAYSASKRLQTTYLSALAQHARMDGVRLHITDIRPGYAQTDILTPGKKYEATIYQDAKGISWDNNPSTYEIRRQKVTSKSVLKLQSAPGGGFAVSLKEIE